MHSVYFPLIENWLFVTPNLDFCVLRPRRGFTSRKKNIISEKQLLSCDSMVLLHSNYVICYQLEEPREKLAPWTLYYFGGYPKSLQWFSKHRPMTNLVRKRRFKTFDLRVRHAQQPTSSPALVGLAGAPANDLMRMGSMDNGHVKQILHYNKSTNSHRVIV